MQPDPKTPITMQTITDAMIYKLGASVGVDMANFDTEEMKKGTIKELETSQTYTLQALSQEKLSKAFNTALQNIQTNPSYYEQNPSVAVIQDPVYSSVIVQEKKLNLKEIYLNEKFNFNSFKNLKPKEQFDFLKNKFLGNVLGQGSSRAAFNIGNGKVLKFAVNNAGLTQNKEEVKNFKTNSEFEKLFPKVFDYDPKFQWVIVEIVNPLSESDSPLSDSMEAKKWKKLTGIDWDTFMINLAEFLENGSVRNNEIEQNYFFTDVALMAKKIGLGIGDLESMTHWGLTSDGRLVILDSGLSGDALSMYNTDNNAILKHMFRQPASFKESKKLTLSKVYINERKFIDMQLFKQLPPIKQVLYLKQNGTVLGEGSSRRVFLIDGKRALKLARNEKGLAQNKAEIEAFNDPMTKGLVTKIYDHDPNYRWVVSELARGFQDEEDFETISGIPFDMIGTLISKNLKNKSMKNFMAGKDYVDTDKIKNPLIGKLIDLVQYKYLMTGDLERLSSWGQTADGRLVLLDYGFTSDVAKKHYSSADSQANTVAPNGNEEDKAEELANNANVNTSNAKSKSKVKEPVEPEPDRHGAPTIPPPAFANRNK